jgi:hypothetical protein
MIQTPKSHFRQLQLQFLHLFLLKHRLCLAFDHNEINELIDIDWKVADKQILPHLYAY